jgi:hypothetical protein
MTTIDVDDNLVKITSILMVTTVLCKNECIAPDASVSYLTSHMNAVWTISRTADLAKLSLSNPVKIQSNRTGGYYQKPSMPCISSKFMNLFGLIVVLDIFLLPVVKTVPPFCDIATTQGSQH